jgi:predicted acetyltransferase
VNVGIDIRRLQADEFAAFHRCAAIAFHEPLDDDTLRRFAEVEELDRSWAAFDGPTIVGTATAYTFSISTPGGECPCAGITWLTTLATHRRRGILTSMLGRLFADAGERGEPLAALWSTTGGVYTRFGFGPAVMGNEYRLALDGTLPFVPSDRRGELRLTLEPAEGAASLLAPVYDEVRARRPGMLSRSPAWWNARVLATPGLLVALARRADDEPPSGYVLYRTHGVAHDATVQVEELVARDPVANATLWRYLCSLEVARAIKAQHRPVDDPIPFLFADPRRANVEGQHDCLWLRLLDVPAALARRRWHTAVQVTLDVADATLPANQGLWKLVVSADGSATCLPAGARSTADISLEAAGLGAAYLGGVTLARLESAGLVHEHTPGAVAALDASLWVPRAPWAPEHF